MRTWLLRTLSGRSSRRFGVALLAAASFAPAAQSQQLPAEGKFSITYTAVNLSPAAPVAISKDRDAIVAQSIMTAVNDAGAGLLHNMAGRCSVISTIDKAAKTIEHKGYCAYVDRDGDEIYEEFATASPQPLGPFVKYKGKWTGGTGKFAGISGDIDITNDSVLESEKLVQTAGKKIGSYTIDRGVPTRK